MRLSKGMRGPVSNRRPSGYEPNVLPLNYLASGSRRPFSGELIVQRTRLTGARTTSGFGSIVERDKGLEPFYPVWKTGTSPVWLNPLCGGIGGPRTRSLLRAKQVLSRN